MHLTVFFKIKICLENCDRQNEHFIDILIIILATTTPLHYQLLQGITVPRTKIIWF